MSSTEDAAAANQAPPSPAPSNPDAAPAPAPAAESAPAVENQEPAESEPEPKANGNDNGNGDSSAPKSARTSSRVKASSENKDKPASASAPPSKKEESKPKSSAPKPRASTSGGGAPSKKSGSGAGGGDKDSKSLKVGDIVLARLKGYPAWPARIADTDNIPRKVAEQRPSKNPSVYCVQFFPVGDYAWLNARDINHLTQSDISEYLAQTHRKSTGGLHEAYQTAQDPTEWDEGQKEFLQQQQADEDEEGENVDELEDEDGEDEEAGSGGKRKKASGGASKQPKKKVKAEKEPAASKSKAKGAAKPKSTAGKSAKAPDSKPADEDKAAGDEDPHSSDPECIKVKDWRHKLQRAFLGKSVPGADEMSTYDDLFKTIEKYDGMTIEALQYSKIGKVMKKIAAMDNIPRNDELSITDRAQKLMTEWSTVVEAKHEGANGGEKNGEKEEVTA